MTHTQQNEVREVIGNPIGYTDEKLKIMVLIAENLAIIADELADIHDAL